VSGWLISSYSAPDQAFKLTHHVAILLQGIAASRWEPAEMLGICREALRHENGRSEAI
jgi:hypothetical protein